MGFGLHCCPSIVVRLELGERFRGRDVWYFIYQFLVVLCINVEMFL